MLERQSSASDVVLMRVPHKNMQSLFARLSKKDEIFSVYVYAYFDIFFERLILMYVISLEGMEGHVKTVTII